jgi:hypothetical protein
VERANGYFVDSRRQADIEYLRGLVSQCPDFFSVIESPANEAKGFRDITRLPSSDT